MVKNWTDLRKDNPESEYDEEKRKFAMVLGKPFITLKVEIPAGYENVSTQFLRLEHHKGFLDEVQKLVKKWLSTKKHVHT